MMTNSATFGFCSNQASRMVKTCTKWGSGHKRCWTQSVDSEWSFDQPTEAHLEVMTDLAVRIFFMFLVTPWYHSVGFSQNLGFRWSSSRSFCWPCQRGGPHSCWWRCNSCSRGWNLSCSSSLWISALRRWYSRHPRPDLVPCRAWAAWRFCLWLWWATASCRDACGGSCCESCLFHSLAWSFPGHFADFAQQSWCSRPDVHFWRGLACLKSRGRGAERRGGRTFVGRAAQGDVCFDPGKIIVDGQKFWGLENHLFKII